MSTSTTSMTPGGEPDYDERMRQADAERHRRQVAAARLQRSKYLADAIRDVTPMLIIGLPFIVLWLFAAYYAIKLIIGEFK